MAAPVVTTLIPAGKPPECAGVAVGVDEAVDDGVVVAALEVIPSRFCVVLVPAGRLLNQRISRKQ